MKCILRNSYEVKGEKENNCTEKVVKNNVGIAKIWMKHFARNFTLKRFVEMERSFGSFCFVLSVVLFFRLIETTKHLYNVNTTVCNHFFCICVCMCVYKIWELISRLCESLCLSFVSILNLERRHFKLRNVSWMMHAKQWHHYQFAVIWTLLSLVMDQTRKYKIDVDH